MDTLSSGDSDPTARRSASDEEAYTTVSSAPPKRRAGRTKFHETRHPVYKGVRRRSSDRWVCEVREPNKKSRIWLGTFPTAEMAARAHDVAAIALRGRSACLNFADSAWLLPVPESSSPRDIQKAAAKIVDRFGSTETMSTDNADVQNAREKGNVVAQERSSSSVGEGFFIDDDGLNLGMEGYFDMAQGMLIDPPPSMMMPMDTEAEGYDAGEMSLWSYSI